MTGDPGHPTGEALLEIALEVAREAARLVRRHRAGEVSVAATKSSDIDVVTQADRESEQLIHARLQAARPDDGFLGEEGESTGTGAGGTTGVRWVVDPIDGTVNFLYGLPQYAVSIAAEVDGTVVAGVVLSPATGVEYTAFRRADGSVESRRDGREIRVRSDVPLAERLVATGFHYVQETRRLQAAAVARLLPEVRDIRRLGSCALDLCHVAEGAFDGYVEEGVNPWDHAAGSLVAQGAGARVELAGGIGGRTLLICAPEAGFRTFRDAVRAAGFLAGTEE